MSSKHIGICALCGKEKELTFEHLPPNKAFNFTPAKPVNGEDFIHASDDKNRVPWDLSGLKYQNQQKGMGPIFENNTWIPEDTRSKAEIEQTIAKNKAGF